MAWNDRAVTMQGLTMLRRCLGGETLVLDYAAGGTGTVPAASLMTQTDVTNRKQTFAFGGPLADVEGGKRVNILITSAGVEQGYTLRQVGIWAHIGQQAPALFALIQDSDGIPVYSQAEFPDFALNFYTVLAVSGSSDIQVHIDPAAMASMEALQAAMEALAPILGNTPPQSTTKGNLGQHYLDQAAGKEYVCLSAAPGEYSWKLTGADQADEILFGEVTVEAALDAIIQDQAEQDEAIFAIQEEIEEAYQALNQATQRLAAAEQAISGHTTAIQGHTGNNTIHVTQADKDGWNAKAATGPAGASAGFGTPTATIDANTGTPSVTVTASGPDTAKVFKFAFKNLKGPKGDTGTTGATGATGPQGPAGANAYAKRAARFVIGTSTAGWTANDCDYLCDGTADDVEINAAIQALPATGGEVIILDGTYKITSKINITKSKVTLSGNGTSTIIQRNFNDGAQTGAIRLHIAHDITIRDITIDGNDSSYSGQNSGICAYYSNQITVERVVIRGEYKGLDIQNVTNGYIGENYIIGSRFYHISVTASAGIRFIGNILESGNKLAYGISMHSGCGYCVIQGNYFIKSSIDLSSCTSSVVTGNVVYQGTYSISIGRECTQVTFSGNIIKDTTSTGIYINGSQNTIIGNTVTRGTGLATDYTASQYTIRADSGSSGNIIGSNNIMGKNYTDSGSGNTWVNNKYN